MEKKSQRIQITQAIKKAEQMLASANIDREEATDLLVHSLKKSRSYCLAHHLDYLPHKKFLAYLSLVKMRQKKIPYAYCIGHKWFYGLEFLVNYDVLIPRPETELLIDRVRKAYARNTAITLADIGTGSGCIAITCAKYFPNMRIIATDLSSKALSVAKKNSRKHSVNVTWKRGSLLAPIPQTLPIDCVIANLPYLEKHELAQVPYEPIQALFGGKYGLVHITALIEQIIQRKIPKAFIEISPTQEFWLREDLKRFEGVKSEFHFDLSEKIRILEISE